MWETTHTHTEEQFQNISSIYLQTVESAAPGQTTHTHLRFGGITSWWNSTCDFGDDSQSAHSRWLVETT